MATSTSDNLQNAAQSAKDTLTQQKDGAADSLGDLAGTLRKAARESDSAGPAANMIDWAATGLESVSATLRNNDLNGMMHQAQTFARQQPVAFFFAAAAAGFLATRFIKAGAQAGSSERRDPQRGAGGYEPGGSAFPRNDLSSTTPF